MDIKRILLISLIAVAIVASASAVSAGWFDFGSNDADNPISAPSNAEKVQLKQDELNDELFIKYGDAIHTEEVHTTDWSGKEKFDYLSMNGQFQVDFDKLPKNVKSAMEKLHDTICKESTNYVDNVNADGITYLTDPSNETGGMYFKLFDKNNKTLLTKNIFITSDLIGKESISQGQDSNNCYVTVNGGNKESFNIHFEWFIDVTDNPELLNTVKNADSGEIHMLVFDEGNAGDCYDVCIPIDHVRFE